MKFRYNVLANYIGQMYVSLLGIIMLPLYIHYMGIETYGLVGFYAMLQSWFQLLDMGLSPTMARQTARYCGGSTDALSLRRLLRTLEAIFIGLALLGAASIIASAGMIANRWLNVEQLPLEEVRHSIMLMGAIVALRWVSGLYRGTINGFERLVWLNIFNAAIVSARFVLVIPLFVYLGTGPVIFFSYQLLVAMVEIAGLVIQSYRLLPKVPDALNVAWQWAPLKDVLKFALSIAFTGSVWIMVTQTDKLVLSNLLPLADYAHFSLTVLVSGGVLMISGPISGALLPRLTKLNAEVDETGVVRLYRKSSQVVAVIAIPVALVLIFFPEQVLWVWTGNASIAQKAAPVLTLYAAGNGILILAAFPYYLQYAKGDLTLHLIGSVIFLVVLLPTLIWATREFGVLGAGFTWMSVNAAYFLFWVPRIHNRFVAGLHRKWLFTDLGGIIIFTVIGAVVLHEFVAWPSDRIGNALILILVSLLLGAIAATSSTSVRGYLIGRYRLHLQEAASRRANLT